MNIPTLFPQDDLTRQDRLGRTHRGYPDADEPSLRPDPIGLALMRLHPGEAIQTLGGRLGQSFQRLRHGIQRGRTLLAR